MAGLDPTGLIWLGARYYDPHAGRFLSPDSVGYPGCLDLYAYANGDPINYTDLDGRFATEAYQKVKTTAINTWDNPRFQGSLQMMGGALETGIGAGFSLATVGWGSVAGMPIMAHGMDHMLAGGSMAMSGKPRSTMTVHALQKAGLSPEKAYMLDAGIGVIATMGAAGHLNAVRAATFPTIRTAIIHSRPMKLAPAQVTPSGGWVLPESGGGAIINKRWYTEHALERMAPNTPQVMATLETRMLQRAMAEGVQPTTTRFGVWLKEGNCPNPRGIPPSVIEAEIANPSSTGVRVILNDRGDVVTVIPRGK